MTDGAGAGPLEREPWNRAAASWDADAAHRDTGPSRATGDRLLAAVAPQPGDHVLEVACGTGELGLRAAELVGPTGRVVCSDFAEAMVAVAARHAEQRDLPWVHPLVLDAERPFLGERFDIVVCRFGYMLMADPGRALRHGADVLRPGGRLALAVWGPAHANPWLSLITDAVAGVLDLPSPPPGTPGPFSLADHGRLGQLLDEAGLRSVQVDDLDADHHHPSIDAWWTHAVSGDGPIASVLAHLDADQLRAVRARASQGARAHAQEDGSVRLPAHIVLAFGRAGPA